MNVVVLVIDTLRADHLGCYGYRHPTSPHIDALAAQSVHFSRHYASAIPTHPAFTTLLSGQYAITHGVVAHGAPRPLPRSLPWLPALFQKAGYTTCAVDNLAQTRMGFLRGFEFYIDPSQRQTLSLTCDNREINRRAVQWLEDNRRDRFFLMMHYWDPHTPYLPPPQYRRLFYSGDPCDPGNRSLEGMERHPLGKMWRETWFHSLDGHITDAEYVVGLYDGEIRYCDEGVGAFLDALDRLNLAGDTLVALLSDHGEMMYRHGIFFDHHGLYDGTLHVPFLIRHPQFEPRRIAVMTEHADVAPTLLSCCGIDAPAEMEGMNLVPWMRGARADAARDAVVSLECTWQMKWCIRTDSRKFILSREPDFYGTPQCELYDLRADPDELNNIADREPESVRELETRLETWVRHGMARNGLDRDPLVAHGLTLGKAWKEECPPGTL